MSEINERLQEFGAMTKRLRKEFPNEMGDPTPGHPKTAQGCLGMRLCFSHGYRA